MEPFGPHANYLKELERRSRESRVHSPHQLTGLTIASILHDLKHKSLYIKLVKEGDPDFLLQLAKSIAERNDINNHGAYFMTMVKEHNSKKKL
ncbi:MAG: hypothetical protein COU08_04570 [Candidatus Harrisonbacteria bacterium CG10_big_fil_rev_8_21_14_0_10_42_17]|uniref:Uncharacterized protein n=1 Tax=Candidatus Harrisonbacteria bacterium CG10_big_fil_rev_8_21_14_0_10_42_17 TaxID=1974584 RepID=A0A2M6WH32_9BACT|nr:MAG: hypothetical protein COU08_04570 [Candidatus Harrisonbacteria bacterium CG10_big_fil_rev_8_21_14_0_10_42_17]